MPVLPLFKTPSLYSSGKFNPCPILFILILIFLVLYRCDVHASGRGHSDWPPNVAAEEHITAQFVNANLEDMEYEGVKAYIYFINGGFSSDYEFFYDEGPVRRLNASLSLGTPTPQTSSPVVQPATLTQSGQSSILVIEPLQDNLDSGAPFPLAQAGTIPQPASPMSQGTNTGDNWIISEWTGEPWTVDGDRWVAPQRTKSVPTKENNPC